MKKMIAKGWLQMGGSKVVPIAIETAFLADEMARVRDEIKTTAPVALTTEATRLYRGKANLDGQYVN